MSFIQYGKLIKEGDNAVIFSGFDMLLNVKVEKNKVHQTRYGALRHNDLIDTPYGRRVNCSMGFVHVLHPTPELWTCVLPHRTQILYSTDISVITLQLDLRPGSIVIESGTGSGSLSHALIRTIAPTGHLYTFDFHEQRVEKAKQEFEDHGIEKYVSVAHRDVCKDGFGLEDIADAVFLDLPNPFEALESAKKALLKTGTGRLCSFSPCIEQVQRACDGLRQLRFIDISVMECLLRPMEVRTAAVPIASLGFEPSAEEQDEQQPPGLLQAAEAGPVLDRNEPENVDLSKPGGQEEAKQTSKNNCVVFKSALAPSQMPGHTGYLVFATLPPNV